MGLHEQTAGGVTINATVQLHHIDEKLIKSILQGYSGSTLYA